MKRAGVFLLLSLISSTLAGRLKLTNGHLSVNGQRVFLSGPNIAWNSYGYDFGNDAYQSSGPTLESWLRSIADAGGNSVRHWLHVEGYNTPQFDSDGFVTGLDNTGSMINEMRQFLDVADSVGIVVIFVLWNGAFMTNQNAINLVWDDAKLQSYIDNALVPMVSALAGHPALGAWEIMNEPEGSVSVQSHADSCADTSSLAGTGAGWTGVNWPMDRIQLFINWQLDAIRNTDPGTLVTLGSWSEQTQSDVLGKKNFYTDDCLRRMGGRNNGILDFYQMHTYSFQGSYASTAPFKHNAADYGLDKPLIIGEFASVCSENNPISTLFDHAYFNGYDGAMPWHYVATGECSDTQQTQNDGMNHIRSYNDQNNGGLVDF